MSLGFWDDELEPGVSSRMLECTPTVGVAKGGLWRTAAGVEKVAVTGSWRLEVERRTPGDLDGQIEELFSHMTGDLDRWNSLPRYDRARLFCGLFLSEFNEGLSLPNSLLVKIADRGLSLELDIYAPD
ncbi:MAG: DUF4279 domain-containing protein [Pseudomonadota bacterium]